MYPCRLCVHLLAAVLSVFHCQLLSLALLGARPRPSMQAAKTHHRDVGCSQAAAAAGGSSGCGGTGGGRRLVRCSTGSRSRSGGGAAPDEARRRQPPSSGRKLPKRRARLEGAKHAQLVHWAICAEHKLNIRAANEEITPRCA